MREVALALVFIAASTASAQVIDASRLGDSVHLAGKWRFHTGDDLNWANPDLDDAGWQLVPVGDSGTQQNVLNVRGYCWFRVRIRVPQETEPLALLMAQTSTYQVFVNGKPVGQYGSFPPHPQTYPELPRVFSLPGVRDSLVLAIRFWLWPNFSLVWGLPGDLILGTQKAVAREHAAIVRKTVVEETPDYVIQILWLLLSCGLVILFSRQRDHSEYLWLAVAAFAAVCSGVGTEYQVLAGMTYAAGSYVRITLSIISSVCVIEFAFCFLRQPMPRLLRLYQFSLPFLLLVVAGYFAGYVSSPQYNAIRFIWYIPYWLFTCAVIFRRYIKGNKEAGLLAIPLSLIFLNDMLSTLGWITFLFGLRHTNDPFVPSLLIGIIPVDPDTIAHFLFLLSVAALILYRFQKTRDEQARATAELEAARSIQEVMVPTAPQSVPGFQVESVYLPAQEVGGDFFQLFPQHDGSLLLVIGDVSGKGMRAAMLVSMILGLVRQIARQTREPGRFLSELNHSLVGEMDGRFTTCCCALIETTGKMSIANAGHLSPYCDGREMDIPGGLPLGIEPDVEYEQIQVTLPLGSRLVFLSDGVVEARNKAGELYGFERTRTISVQPVATIASTAQTFGQEDDITVVGIEKQAVAFA